MATFRIDLSHLTPDLKRFLENLPGVTLRERCVTAPDNAAWLVEKSARLAGVRFSTVLLKEDRVPLQIIEELVKHGLREWVPGFLTPYQREGILAMAHRDGHLWWAAGSGKTAGAICWSLAYPGATVVVTRAGVRRSHAREIERLTEHRALVIEGAADAKKLEDTDALFVVVGWENLPDVIDQLLAWRPQNVVFDEAHKAKSNKRWTATPQEDGRVKFDALNNIAQAAYRLSRRCTRRLATTATPIKDRTRDLWAQLDLVHPDAWGRFYSADRASFTGRYCAARPGLYGGIETGGSSNLEELWERVSVVVHQVPHSETHRHLPPRRRLVTYVTQAEQCQAVGFTKSYFKQAAKGGQSGILEARLCEAAAKKRKLLLELVTEAAEMGQKIVIFTGRREDCDRLAEDVGKLNIGARIFSGHGGTPPSVRDQIQQDYMAAAGPAVLIGTGDAWGECLDPDTFILGANKPLRDCVDGDAVFGKAGVAASESATIHPYRGHMVEIRAQGLFPMRSTTGHATLTVAGSVTRGRDRRFELRGEPTWKNAEDVKPWVPTPKNPAEASGDFLLVPRLLGKFTDVRFDLNEFVSSDDARKMRQTKGCPQELPLTPDVAWVLGLFVAEGSVTGQQAGQMRVTFSLGAHERYIADRVVAILGAQGFKVRVRQQQTWLHVTVKSTPLGKFLRKLTGVGAANKRIPDEVLLNTDLTVLRAFLDGYAEGDGHESDGNRKVYAYTVSKALALHLQLALARFGRLAGITPRKAQTSHINGRTIHGNGGFIVVWRWFSTRHDRFKVLDRYIATPVKSVEIEPYEGLVGYMTTQDHSMLASNAVVHNGVNLQDTDLMLIAMLPYTPGQIVQWEGRVARHGQKRPVLIQYLVAENTVDEHVAGILLDKLPAVERVSKDDSLDGFSDALMGADQVDEIMGSILSKLGVA